MDSVTHGLFPYSLAAFLKRSRVECAAVLLGAVGPDLDVLFAWLGYLLQEPVISHRGITHTIFFGFFFAAVLLYLFSRPVAAGFLKRALGTQVGLDFNLRLLGFTYFGILFHIFLDSLTSRGIPLLYPLTQRRFSAEIFFYIDPYLLSLSGVIFFYLLARWKKTGDLRDVGKKLFVVYLVAFLVVGGLRAYEKGIAYGAVEGEDKTAYATQNPFVWSVVSHGDVIKVYSYDSLTHNVTYFRAVNRFNVRGENATFPFEQALAEAERLPDVREFELDARAVSVEAYFDGNAKEWVLEFTDPASGIDFSRYGAHRPVGARVSQSGAY